MYPGLTAILRDSAVLNSEGGLKIGRLFHTMLDTWIEGASDHLRPDPPKPGTKHLGVRSMGAHSDGQLHSPPLRRPCHPRLSAAVRIKVHRGKALANPSVRALMLSDFLEGKRCEELYQLCCPRNRWLGLSGLNGRGAGDKPREAYRGRLR